MKITNSALVSGHTSVQKYSYQCLLLVRISTTKQLQESDSPEHQIRQGLATAQKRFGYSQHEVMILTEAYSGRKEERPCLDQALDLASKHQLKQLLIYDIDRLTRAGVSSYEQIKLRFKKLGCDLVDVKGIIQPDRNVLEGTGASFGDDFAYDWSVFATSEKAEIMEAQMAKDEARKILSRTIPVQIKNAQLGRTNRWAPYGYKNVKIIDGSGKPQPSKIIDEEEAFYVRKMFEGLAGGRDCRQLCDEINGLGFSTRRFKRWNADHSQVIGSLGGKSITPKGLRRMTERVVHAGFILEKWTHGFPVKANHEGIVSTRVWNAANKGHWRLAEAAHSPTGWELAATSTLGVKRAYVSDRPEFPFKKLILCSICHKPLKGSFSRGKSGKRFAYYHCGRGHKQISISPDKLHHLIAKTLKSLVFSPEIAARFEKHIREVWLEKIGGLNKHLAKAAHELGNMRDQADALFEKIKIASSPLIIKRLEEEYEDLQHRIQRFESNRDEKELGEADMNRIIQQARYLVEHLDELVLNAQNEGLRTSFWSLIFVQPPRLENIQNQTPRISPLVQLKSTLEQPKEPLVTQRGLRSNPLLAELTRWASILTSYPNPFNQLINPKPQENLGANLQTLPQAA